MYGTFNRVYRVLTFILGRMDMQGRLGFENLEGEGGEGMELCIICSFCQLIRQKLALIVLQYPLQPPNLGSILSKKPLKEEQ